jgi:Leucine-rich repeat (LRR) protein
MLYLRLMTRDQRKLFYHTKKEILSANYDKIDQAINDLISADEPDVYRALLYGCSIGRKHSIRVPWQFIVASPNQPAIDYAFWQLIGWAPSNDVLPKRIKKSQIQKVLFPTYESIAYHLHGVKKLPSGFVNFKNLSVIEARNNEVEALPAEYVGLTNMRLLDLHHNRLKKFPVEITTWQNLEHLNLSGNNMSGPLPLAIGNLKSLLVLVLSRNGITHLPDTISRLTSLKDFDVSCNKIAALPAYFQKVNEKASSNLTGWKNLEKLNLSYNKLTFVPAGFRFLSKLTKLELQNNDISELNPTLGNLTSLESLNLGHNELTTLPSEIGNLTNLTSLELTGNREFRELPFELSNLENLTYLGMGMCLNVLPKSQLRYLKGKDLQEYIVKIKRKYGAIPRFSKKRVKKKNTETNNIRPAIQTYNTEKPEIKTFADKPKEAKKTPYSEETISTANLILSYLNSKEFETITMGLEMLRTLNSPDVCGYIINEGFKFNFNQPFTIEQGRWRNNERIHILCHIAFHFDYDNLKKFRQVIFNTKKADFCLEYLRLGDFFWKLSNLEIVRIECEKSRIPNQIVSFSKVHTLKIQNGIFESTRFLQSMKSLKKLDVDQCKSSRLVSHGLSFDGIHSLELLEIENSVFPDLRILNMPHLIELDISLRNSSNIKISGCPNLKKVRVHIRENSENAVLHIDNTPNLSDLKIDNFSISNLLIGSNTLSQLERIELRHVNTSSIPEWLYDAANLKFLKANHCQLIYIDDSISKFQQLEELDLDRNWLNSIPEEILQCKKLKKLSIFSTLKQSIRIPIPVYGTKQFKLEHNIPQIHRRRIERKAEQMAEKTFIPKSSSRA